MRIVVNGAEHDVHDGTTVADLISTLAGAHRGSAIVLDGEIVPRSRWVGCAVPPGAQVELITAVQGG